MDAVIQFLMGLPPAVQALAATLFTWGVTALGAATVFLPFQFSRRVLDGMLGFAAGVMIAASFWSLLAPAIEYAERGSGPAWLPALVGFLAGAAMLRAIDLVLPHLHPGPIGVRPEGVQTSLRRTVLMILAITLHNFPEGLAVGVAFGAAASGLVESALVGAVVLAIGIGLQNFPEGIAVAVPLQREGLSRRRSFFYGQLSAAVEPVAGVLGAAAVSMVAPLLPYALGFAAGAMIFVVVEDVIPEAQGSGHTDTATLGTMLGFAIMMTLDVALG